MPVQVRPAVPEAASGDNRPFWAIFLCKENSPQKGIMPRLFIAFQASCFCGLYCSPCPFFPFSPAFSRSASPEQAPPSAPMSAAGVTSMASMGAISTPTTAPTRAGAMMTVAIAIATMNSGPIFMMLPFKRSVSLATKGYFRPLTSHERKLVSIIQLIVRNVK